MNFKKIIYSKLNSRQKENYNYQKVSSVLADYGFQTIKLSDDWKGADFLAQHTDGKTSLKIQLKMSWFFYRFGLPSWAILAPRGCPKCSRTAPEVDFLRNWSHLGSIWEDFSKIFGHILIQLPG